MYKPFYRMFLPVLLLVGAPVLPGFTMADEQPGSVNVQLLGINDLHGQLDQPRSVNNRTAGSAPVLAAYLRERAALNPHTLLLQIGDMVGASAPESSLLQDEPTIDVLNSLGFDIGTVGNHEFDEGIPEMKRLIDGGYHERTGYYTGAEFPYIVANVMDKNTGRPILPPHYVKVVDGVPIGFIGVVTKSTAMVVKKSYLKDVEFTDEAAAVNREVKALRDKGVETIIVLAHEGGWVRGEKGEVTGEIADITKKLDPAVDVVFSGHTHTQIQTTIDDKLVVQALSHGLALADVDLVIDRVSGDVVDKQAEIIPTYTDGVQPDPDVKRIVDAAKKRIEPLMKEVIGETAGPITREPNEAGESALGNMIADAQRKSMNADFAFTNHRGIQADLPAGKVTWGDAYAAQPFGNELVKMELTGNQIKKVLDQQFQGPSRTRILQVSGLTFTWNPNRPGGKRILALRRADGTPIDPRETYSVVVNSYLAEGGGGFTAFEEGTQRMIGDNELDVLIDYIKQKPQPFSAQIEGRIMLQKGS
ncbi:bifunctional metallophosphatase/5'-nucleotidase [Laceyella putida]|uniref:Bifunctional metallophosphatase/5'-nucleotidase n=1 Tax=Laceyella putida TaxID=110101 RepID=A0ABW2RFG4_9BACL